MTPWGQTYIRPVMLNSFVAAYVAHSARTTDIQTKLQCDLVSHWYVCTAAVDPPSRCRHSVCASQFVQQLLSLQGVFFHAEHLPRGTGTSDAASPGKGAVTLCNLLLQVPPAPAPAPSKSSADYFYVFKLPQDAPAMPDTISMLKFLLSKQPTYLGRLLCMLHCYPTPKPGNTLPAMATTRCVSSART